MMGAGTAGGCPEPSRARAAGGWFWVGLAGGGVGLAPEGEEYAGNRAVSLLRAGPASCAHRRSAPRQNAPKLLLSKIKQVSGYRI